MYKNILVPLDGSPLAETVLPYVKQLAPAIGASVTLLRVNEPTREQLEGKQKLTSRSGKPPAREIKAYLQKVADYLKVAKVSTKVILGVPSVEIIEEARNVPDTLTAMATHGRGVTRWLLGSVAEKVVRTAACPVLTVRHARPASTMPAKELDALAADRVPAIGGPDRLPS